MAFNLTYHNILNNNIRHVYYGKPLSLHYRQSSEYPNMDQLRKRREDQLLKNYVLRMSEYWSDYHCLIPRASAFRVLSRHLVDDIVKRLYEPPPTNTSRSIEARKSREKGSEVKRKTLSREQRDEVFKRVLRPTAISTIREHPPQRLVAMGLNFEYVKDDTDIYNDKGSTDCWPSSQSVMSKSLPYPPPPA